MISQYLTGEEWHHFLYLIEHIFLIFWLVVFLHWGYWCHITQSVWNRGLCQLHKCNSGGGFFLEGSGGFDCIRLSTSILRNGHILFANTIYMMFNPHKKLAYCHHLDLSRRNLHFELGSNGTNKVMSRSLGLATSWIVNTSGYTYLWLDLWSRIIYVSISCPICVFI